MLYVYTFLIFFSGALIETYIEKRRNVYVKGNVILGTFPHNIVLLALLIFVIYSDRNLLEDYLVILGVSVTTAIFFLYRYLLLFNRCFCLIFSIISWLIVLFCVIALVYIYIFYFIPWIFYDEKKIVAIFFSIMGFCIVVITPHLIQSLLDDVLFKAHDKYHKKINSRSKK